MENTKPNEPITENHVSDEILRVYVPYMYTGVKKQINEAKYFRLIPIKLQIKNVNKLTMLVRIAHSKHLLSIGSFMINDSKPNMKGYPGGKCI